MLGGLGLGLASTSSASGVPDAEPIVRRRATLGRTGLEVPDIGFGTSRLSGDGAEDAVRHALDRGIDYFDTAESYQGGEAEQVLGRALAGRRDDVMIASKVKCGERTRVSELRASLEATLKRLRTDRVEIYFNHAVNDTDRLRNDAWYEFADRAKQEGLIRFTGMSGHGGRLVPCLDLAIDENLVDVVLVGFNFGQDPAFHQRFTSAFDFVAVQPDLPRVLRKARAAGIGVVAMKTLRGARLNDMRPYETAGATFAQAAFRWTLTSDLVDSLVVTMKEPSQIDEYLGASGATGPNPADAALLRRYANATERSQCRYGCNDCAPACPEGVPISDVLRMRMYADDYGDPALARGEYAALPVDATACVGCPAPCHSACPHGVEIPGLTRRAHHLLTRS